LLWDLVSGGVDAWLNQRMPPSTKNVSLDSELEGYLMTTNRVRSTALAAAATLVIAWVVLVFGALAFLTFWARLNPGPIGDATLVARPVVALVLLGFWISPLFVFWGAARVLRMRRGPVRDAVIDAITRLSTPVAAYLVAIGIVLTVLELTVGRSTALDTPVADRSFFVVTATGIGSIVVGGSLLLARLWKAEKQETSG
jgi:hypothetical protein